MLAKVGSYATTNNNYQAKNKKQCNPSFGMIFSLEVTKATRTSEIRLNNLFRCWEGLSEKIVTHAEEGEQKYLIACEKSADNKVITALLDFVQRGYKLRINGIDVFANHPNFISKARQGSELSNKEIEEAAIVAEVKKHFNSK